MPISDNYSWSLQRAHKAFSQSFHDILYQAHTIFRQHFNHNKIQVSTLLSIKTGACPENCKYCTQSAHYSTGLVRESLLDKEQVLQAARAAKGRGATRFCMGAAWRSPTDRDLDKVAEMIEEVKSLELETCVTLGLLKPGQAERLKTAGLDYYNHNLDTSEEFYKQVVTTRTFQNRLDTLEQVRSAGIKVCCGGIIGMGESLDDRLSMLTMLANMPEPPESIPINLLVKIPGTPMADVSVPDSLEFVKLISLTRIMMPRSYVRLSAGREGMSEELQALCFFAGANSIFYGERLLTAANHLPSQDDTLFDKLGLIKEIKD